MKKNKTEHTSNPRHVALLNEHSPFATKEAYNAVRTKLMFAAKGETCPVFAVTSSLMHDGKTTNAVNIAISIAMAEKKVLLIDADMRRPSIHNYFGFEAKDGLSEILAGLTNGIRLRKTPYENLNLLTSGQIPPNPAELLGSEQMERLLEYVRQYFDYVIIDTPPVNIVTDASVLAEQVTGFLYVVQSGNNHFRDLDIGLRTLEQMNGRVVGLLLNDLDGSGEHHYTYRYGKYGYNNHYYRYSEKYGAYE